jgi:hypothetical protein
MLGRKALHGDTLGLTGGAPAVSPPRTMAKPVRLQFVGERSRVGTDKNYEAH